MKIKRFEDIEAWKEARILTNMVSETIKTSPTLSTKYWFKDQILSSSISIMANIAEGFSRRHNKEFIQFLFIAKASASETQSHLYVALDQEHISQAKFDALYTQCDKVSRLISKFISYLIKNTTNPTNSTNPKNSNGGTYVSKKARVNM